VRVETDGVDDLAPLPDMAPLPAKAARSEPSPLSLVLVTVRTVPAAFAAWLPSNRTKAATSAFFKHERFIRKRVNKLTSKQVNEQSFTCSWMLAKHNCFIRKKTKN
jgi:hypothetical protein